MQESCRLPLEKTLIDPFKSRDCEVINMKVLVLPEVVLLTVKKYALLKRKEVA